MIVDFHTHVLPPHIREERRRYVERDAAFAAIYSHAKAAIATAEELIENMDREEIDLSVIVNYSWSTPEMCRETNDYILESCYRYPGRLAGFCAVPDFTSEFSMQEIERCYAGRAVGIGELRPDFHAGVFTDREAMQSFTDSLRKYSLLLLLHASEPVGHQYHGKGLAFPGMIYPFLQSARDIKVICAHWGGGLPFYSLMPEVREAISNVYFDTAASPFLYRPEIYNTVIGLAGADKVLFGSDFPVMKPGRILREIDGSGMSRADREMVLGGNAMKLLGR